jgi:hypothetical protein
MTVGMLGLRGFALQLAYFRTFVAGDPTSLQGTAEERLTSSSKISHRSLRMDISFVNKYSESSILIHIYLPLFTCLIPQPSLVARPSLKEAPGARLALDILPSFYGVKSTVTRRYKSSGMNLLRPVSKRAIYPSDWGRQLYSITLSYELRVCRAQCMLFIEFVPFRRLSLRYSH